MTGFQKKVVKFLSGLMLILMATLFSSLMPKLFAGIPNPAASTVYPSTAPNNGNITVRITGINLEWLTKVLLKKSGETDISGINIGLINATNADCTFNLTGKTTGYWSLYPYNASDNMGGAIIDGFLITQAVSATSNVDNSNTTTVIITPDSGKIMLGIPPNTFGQNVSLTVSTTSVPSSSIQTIKPTNIGIEVTTDVNAQPDKAITITMYYRDADIAGLDESKLVICRFDPLNNLWTPLPSTVYPDQNKVVALTDHLSKFALVQLAPASNISSVKIYPNPLNSKLYSMTIANLTANADIKIYSVAGELVRTVGYTTGNGQAIWDGRNDSGSLVASGVYIIYIKSDSGTKKIKIAVEK